MSSILHEPHLALKLILQSAVDGAEAVHVFDLYLDAEPVAAPGADADIGVAAEAPLLHVAGGYADVLEDGAQGDEVLTRLLGRTQVRLSDDLHERNAGAVDVQQAVGIAGGVGAVKQLGYVLFQVDAGYTGALVIAVHGDLHPAIAGDGLVEL